MAVLTRNNKRYMINLRESRKTSVSYCLFVVFFFCFATYSIFAVLNENNIACFWQVLLYLDSLPEEIKPGLGVYLMRTIKHYCNCHEMYRQNVGRYEQVSRRRQSAEDNSPAEMPSIVEITEEEAQEICKSQSTAVDSESRINHLLIDVPNPDVTPIEVIDSACLMDSPVPEIVSPVLKPGKANTAILQPLKTVSNGFCSGLVTGPSEMGG